SAGNCSSRSCLPEISWPSPPLPIVLVLDRRRKETTAHFRMPRLCRRDTCQQYWRFLAPSQLSPGALPALRRRNSTRRWSLFCLLVLPILQPVARALALVPTVRHKLPNLRPSQATDFRSPVFRLHVQLVETFLLDRR